MPSPTSQPSSIETGRVALVFPANVEQGLATDVLQSRLADTAAALAAAGLEVVGAPYADTLVDQVRARLLSVDGVLVWVNPIEAGRDRAALNALLRDVATKGVRVSAHPDVIDSLGTKEILYRTRAMNWGCDTRLYDTPAALRSGLIDTLASGRPRVLKQMRGQSGEGVWKVQVADASHAAPGSPSMSTPVLVRHARRGSVETAMPLQAFLEICRPYFEAGGMIDQAYQDRLPEGMIRCYLVGDRVAGFGEQLVNALYPAPSGATAQDAPQPGPRLYFPPTRPDFQALKHKLEREWLADLCSIAGLAPSELPILWDADFLYGPKDATGADTYVLCEINVSSVYPFPADAMTPLVERVKAWLAA